MVEEKNDEFEAVSVTTEQRVALMKGGKEFDLYEVLAKVANDVNDIKKGLLSTKK